MPDSPEIPRNKQAQATPPPCAEYARLQEHLQRLRQIIIRMWQADTPREALDVTSELYHEALFSDTAIAVAPPLALPDAPDMAEADNRADDDVPTEHPLRPRWVAAVDMYKMPRGWYWSEDPGAWEFFSPERDATQSLFHGHMQWQALISRHYWGPWHPPEPVRTT